MAAWKNSTNTRWFIFKLNTWNFTKIINYIHLSLVLKNKHYFLLEVQNEAKSFVRGEVRIET